MLNFFISLIITCLIMIPLGFLLGIFKKENIYDQKEEIPKPLGIVKVVVYIILLIILMINIPIGIQRIDAGNVGLKIDRVGNSRGIPVAVPVKGWVFYNTWLTDVVEYNIRQNHIAYTAFSVSTKGGTPLDVAPSFNYALKPDRATDVYINLLKGGEFDQLKDTWIATATMIAMRNAVNTFTIDSIFNHQAIFQQAVEKEMNRELSKYFVVSQINPGQRTPESMRGILQSKAQAIQQAQQADLDRQTADAQAYTKIATARGDSAALVIQAASEAKAIQLKTRELSDNYVSYIKWINANPDVPRVPQTVLGSNTSVLLSK